MVACLDGLKHLVDLRRWPATLESDYLRVTQMVEANDHVMSSSWAQRVIADLSRYNH
jgi:hypothetical protein